MKVNFIIAGFQKCGTTALHSFLSSHPKVVGSNPKETDFFNYEFHKGYSFYHGKYFRKVKFSNLRRINYLDTSPSYLIDKNVIETAERIYEYNKNVKIIGLVRDPVHRAFSAWNMYKKRYESGNKDWWIKWVENRYGERPDVIRRQEDEYQSFYLYIKNEIEILQNNRKIECPILDLGLYAEGIKVFKKQFGENFKILRNEDLEANTAKELETIGTFLNLKQYNWKQFENKKVFSGIYHSEIDDDARSILTDYYRLNNEQLKSLTGIKY